MAVLLREGITPFVPLRGNISVSGGESLGRLSVSVNGDSANDLALSQTSRSFLYIAAAINNSQSIRVCAETELRICARYSTRRVCLRVAGLIPCSWRVLYDCIGDTLLALGHDGVLS